jgi:hypothetical protein
VSLAIEQFVAATAGRAAQETSPDDETVGLAMHVTSPLQDEQPNVAANNPPSNVFAGHRCERDPTRDVHSGGPDHAVEQPSSNVGVVVIALPPSRSNTGS